MLLSFAVSNYKSFKNKQTFELVSSASQEYRENLFEIDSNHRVNKNACIIGANSSGKTHFLRAIEMFANSIKKAESVKEAHQPFCLDKTSTKSPTVYEALLFDSDKSEYLNYSFSVFSGKIIQESLHAKDKRKNAKVRLIFERNDDKIKFAKEYKSIEELLVSTIDVGGLITNYASSLKNDSIKFVMNWASNVFLFNPKLMNHIGAQSLDIISGAVSSMLKGSDADKDSSSEQSKEAGSLIKKLTGNIKKLIECLDLPIDDVIYKKKEDGSPYLIIIPKTLEDVKIELTMDEAKEFFSEGTFNTLNIVIIIELFSYGKTTLLIDEYDGTLHHKLSIGVLDLIRSKDKNFTSQMIMSTHDILLIDKGFRRDSVFVFRKDKELSSIITRVSEYSVRKDAKLSLKYLSEEFGALPNIMSNSCNE